VVVRLDYSGRVLLFELQGTLGQATTTADAQGNWAVTFSQNAPAVGVDLEVNATAVDPLNRRSEPATVKLKQG
jgi:hypothetical protein